MSRRYYNCTNCGDEIYINIPITESSPDRITEHCARCSEKREFDHSIGAPYVTFGMLTKKYTGQQAAVNGWGTYATDYKKSDLVAGRAREAAEERVGTEIKGKPKRVGKN